MVRRCTAAVVLALSVLALPAAAETPEEIFERGNTAYEGDDFAGAAEAYRTVLRYGIRDAFVEYNLGNAEFRLGHLGPAILHYERARRLDPTDPDILANLEFARSYSYDRVERAEEAVPLRWLRRVQDRTGAERQAWAALGLWWILAAVIAFGLWRPAGWRAAHGWALSVSLGLLATVGVSWYATERRAQGEPTAVVLDEVVEILAGPGPNNPALTSVHEGLTLEIRAERQDWLQVGLPNGLNGWIPRSALEPV